MSDSIDFETGSQAAPQSIAERMKAEIAARKAAKAQVIELRHDAVPALTITCRVPADGEEIADIAQRADKRAKNSGTGTVWFNRLLLARYTETITWDGELLEDERGVALTFASRTVQEMVNASDGGSAVHGIFGSDAYISVLADELMNRAGFGNDAAVEVVEDPTKGR